MLRIHSFSDRIIAHIDNAVRTLSPGAVKAKSPSPATGIPAGKVLSTEEEQHIGKLMRINHTGEVCAQALYQGQALTARLPSIKESMTNAADEELDHLAWCETRINELKGRTSYLNPAFYGLSFALGAIAGIAGDKWSLGFVAATEDQVSLHLKDHLQQVTNTDSKTTAILTQMLADEQRHAEHALQAGGIDFPTPVKQTMTFISKAMTKTTYRI